MFSFTCAIIELYIGLLNGVELVNIIIGDDESRFSECIVWNTTEDTRGGVERHFNGIQIEGGEDSINRTGCELISITQINEIKVQNMLLHQLLLLDPCNLDIKIAFVCKEP